MNSIPTLDRVRMHNGVLVLRDIDWGRAVQFWLFPGTADDLEQWWTSQESFDSNPDGAVDPIYQAVGETPPPHRDPIEPPGKFINVICEEEMDLWTEMYESQRHYFCVLCCDRDSFLRSPGGAEIHHMGYTDDRISRTE